MGLLNIFSRPEPAVQVLPSGTLTLDRHGNILARTVASGISQEVLEQVGLQIVTLFRSAALAQIPLAELTLHFGSLQLTARELRGGAIIFLSPKNSLYVSPQIEMS